jgi:hypothetical protein
VKHLIHSIAKTSILAGAQPGRAVLAHLVAHTPRGGVPRKVFLDFTGIEAATGSFLRECVFGFRDFCRTSAPSVYPVLANLDPTVEEEVEFYAQQRNEAVWSCRLSEQGTVESERLIGREMLDAGHDEALGLVESLTEATAPAMSRATESKLRPTTWNNRLAALSSKGLVVEMQRGKTKVFQPVWRID